MALILAAGLLLALAAGAAWLMWRRLEAMGAQIRALRDRIEALEGAGAVRRRESLRLASGDHQPMLFPEPKRSATPQSPRVLRFGGEPAPATPAAMPDTLRGVLLALAATAPAFGLFVGLELGLVSAMGLAVGAAMMLLALSRSWGAAAWTSVITAAGWAIAAFAFGAVAMSPAPLALALTLAGLAGLVQAFLSRTAPGGALSLIAALGALAMGAQLGMIGPAGLSFGVIVCLAAMVGALNLRLEFIHLCAFAAALIGLFVLSGQDSAAIWFTPAAAWAGAIFFGIAVIRVPDLGARGVTLAGTGVLGPVCAIAALYWSGHGLASPYAAAAALAATALACAGLIVATAQRGARTLASLRLTLWVLASAAFGSCMSAIFLIAPAPFAANAFMLAAIGLLALDLRAPDALWRTLALLAGALGASCAGASALLVLGEAGDPIVTLAVGIVLPALLAGAAAHLAGRQPSPVAAALFEALAITMGVFAANLLLRVLVSGGALLLTPVSFAEAGLHISLWLIASLLLAARQRYGAQNTRAFAAMALGVLALAASAAAMLLWLTPHWSERAPGEGAAALLRFDGLGFLAPAILFGAHWVLWRGRGANMRTRLALGAGALMAAALLTLLALQAGEQQAAGPDWFGAMVGALSFAAAISVNFASGVTLQSLPRPSYFEENLQSHRRRKARRQGR